MKISRSILMLSVVGILSAGCALNEVDSAAIREARVERIGIVIGSGARGRVGVTGSGFPRETLEPLTPGLQRLLDEIALKAVWSALETRGYAVRHLRTQPIEWDTYANISDTPASFERLSRQYGAAWESDPPDAVLIVEYMIMSRTWGREAVSDLTLGTFNVVYARSKIWLFDLRTGKRLLLSSRHRGYDQVLSNVGPREALADVLSIAGLPRAPGAGEAHGR